MTLQEFSDTFDTLLSAYANKPDLYGDQGSLRDIDLDEYEKSVLLTLAQDLVVKSYFDAKYNLFHDGMDDSTRRQVDFSSLITVAQPLRVTGTAGGWAEASLYFKNTYNSLQGSGTEYTYYKVLINFGNGIITEAPYATMTGGGRTIIMNVGAAKPSLYYADHLTKNGTPVQFGKTVGADHVNVGMAVSLKKRDGKVVGVNVSVTSNSGNNIQILSGSSSTVYNMVLITDALKSNYQSGVDPETNQPVYRGPYSAGLYESVVGANPHLETFDDFVRTTDNTWVSGKKYYKWAPTSSTNNVGGEYTKAVNGNTTVYTIPVNPASPASANKSTWSFIARPIASPGYSYSKWNVSDSNIHSTASNGFLKGDFSVDYSMFEEDTTYYVSFDAAGNSGVSFLISDTGAPNYLGVFTLQESILDASSIVLVSQFTSKLNHYDERGIIYQMPKNILFMLNEKVVAANTSKHYVVVPINYKEYDRQMSRAFAQPFKRQCWRLFQGVDSGIYDLNSEIIPIEGTSIDKYTIRYIRRPCPIILTDLDFSESQEPLNIDGISVATECELNPILHMDILLKAIELAAASKGGTKSTAQLLQQQRAAQQQ